MATTIAIDPGLRDRLRTYGIAGDTYNDIIARLLDEFDREEFVRWIRHRARTNTDWVELDDL